MNKARITSLIVPVSFLVLLGCSHGIKGSGSSVSRGAVNNGSLENGRRFPRTGENYKYFSRSRMGRAWVHEDVLAVTLEAYETMQEKFPEKKFLLMECSHKEGGKLWPHRTHQNGTSIDFGTPLLKKGQHYRKHHGFGIAHYLMKFNEKGVSAYNKRVEIDFELMAQHILALEESARKRGMYIKKVIFKIDLKDDFFETNSGKIVKRKNIYFARSLPKLIDNLHDDHYHVDFGWLK